MFQYLGGCSEWIPDDPWNQPGCDANSDEVNLAVPRTHLFILPIPSAVRVFNIAQNGTSSHKIQHLNSIVLQERKGKLHSAGTD